MSAKIYIKRGNPNYREKKLIRKIQDALEKNPELEANYRPANSLEELEARVRELYADEVEFEETKNESASATESDNSDSTDDLTGETSETPKKDIIDPFNREEPIVNDYVMNGNDLKRDDESKTDGQTAGAKHQEPTSFTEAFEMPEGSVNVGNNGGGAKKTEKSTGIVDTTVNRPSPDAKGDDAKSKKSTKRFAKYIVHAVCGLAEKGFIWYANNETNEAKLAEYELNGEIDLSLLVTLNNGQTATVKTFFLHQCKTAEQVAKFSEEEKSDLTDALYEVMLEKGVKPTPMQELIVTGLGILGVKAAGIFAIKAQTTSVLTQLRIMQKEVNDMYSNAEKTSAPADRTPSAEDLERHQTGSVQNFQDIANPEEIMKEATGKIKKEHDEKVATIATSESVTG